MQKCCNLWSNNSGVNDKECEGVVAEAKVSDHQKPCEEGKGLEHLNCLEEIPEQEGRLYGAGKFLGEIVA